MASTKTAVVHDVQKDIVNRDSRLDFLPDILAKLRREYLSYEPGTEAQATAYRRYEEALRLQATGVIYVPKF